MKKALALVLAAGAFLAFPHLAFSQSIFSSSSSFSPSIVTEETTYCLGEDRSLSACAAAHCDPRYTNVSPCSSTIRNKEYTREDGGKAQVFITGTFGTNTNYSRGYTYYFSVKDNPKCPPDENANGGSLRHSYMYEEPDGGKMCYDPRELAENSSCPDSTSASEYILPASGATPSHVCVTHSDESRCSYNLSESGDYYSASFENSQCYGQDDDLPNPDTPADGYCKQTGDVLMCNENPSNVCDANGNCQTGCGSYSYDGVEAFVCFAQDTDSDGVPNYSDTDIDGDGIPNTEDEDWDGDGINDPAYGSGRDGSAGTETGNDNTGDNQTGGNAQSGPGIEELKDEFIEQGDFSTSAIEKLMSDARDSNNNAIDSLIESDQANFSNAIGESSISSDLDVSEIFSSGCSASFKIPFSNSNLDMCEAADRARPFLYVIFALATFIFCSRQIVNTVRGTD